MVKEEERRNLMGYESGDGGVGKRNLIGVIQQVKCYEKVQRYIEDYLNRMGGLDGLENVDGVVELKNGRG